jgi:predicted AAA+ superfamily ATPase
MSENWGVMAENAVAVELLRREGEEGVFYWKDRVGGWEVDFVVVRDTQVAKLIQVCWDARDGRTLKREVRALSRGMEELNCDRGVLLTGYPDELEGVDWEEGMEVVGLEDWLTGYTE